MTKAFIAAPAAPHAAPVHAVKSLPAASLSAAAMTIPSAAHAAETSVWIP
eukprot:CAMPEP_0172706200 /NCGR_PEP_ID=MMETSP1074-20121228/45857_1 /TAXON_ID=2916 /ORGANISM="Ceratium fusus, Strain PA161109" /LENGTH=49 /DNA_ID= /DNA_START= /DNA_END= /DNA_ORIENTATION=